MNKHYEHRAHSVVVHGELNSGKFEIMDIKNKPSFFGHVQIYFRLFLCVLLLQASANNELNQEVKTNTPSSISTTNFHNKKQTEQTLSSSTVEKTLRAESETESNIVQSVETTTTESNNEIQTSNKTSREVTTRSTSDHSSTVSTLDAHENVSFSRHQTTSGRPRTTNMILTNPTTQMFDLPTASYTFYYELQTVAPTAQTVFQLYQPSVYDMESVMEHGFIVDYLDTFENDLQRSIVRIQLQHCPYNSLCTFGSIAIPDLYSCCLQCECNTSACGPNKDCCPSVVPSEDFKFSNDTSPNKVWSINDDVLSNLTCIPNVLSHQTEDGFLANARCPDDASKELNDLCTRLYSSVSMLADIVPVYSNISGLIFRNKYCALCNNISTDDIVSFGTHFSCLEQSSFERATSIQDAIAISLSVTDCEISFIFYDTQLIPCHYVIDKCNVSGNWETYDPFTESACGLYTSKVKYDGLYYRNIYCALCNEVVPKVTCGSNNPVRSANFGFSGLLSLETEQAILSTEAPTIKDTKASCGNNQTFDVLFEKCQDLFCPDKSFPHDRACISMFTAVSDSMMYIVEIRLLPTSTFNIFDALDIQDPLLGIIYERVRITDALDLCNIQMIFKTDLKYSKLNNVQNVNPRVMYADIKIELLKQNFAGAQNPSNVADEILKNRFRSVSVNTSVGVPLEFQMVFTQLDFKLYNILNQFGKTQQFSYSFSRKNITDRINVLLNYGLPDLDGFTFIPNIDFYYTAPCEGLTLKEISILKYSSCPKVYVSADDIKWSDTLDGIVVDDLKINRATFYYTDDKHIMMCVDQYENLARHLLPKRSLTPEIIVSIVCNGLSITALLITVTTMAILPTLRNSLPGHNNLCLSLSLLIAQILYLVGTIGIFDQYSVACKTVALLIHVSWLYVVFWMNVCTYHLYITLTRTHVHSQKIGVKKCLSYHLYVLMFSLLFVGLNILISFLQSTGIGYGGKYCYITSRERILITFLSPTILIVLANLVMFLFVTCRVTKSSGIRKSVRNDRNDLIILTKLASITGIGWIFGFLYTWTEVSILSYIFIVLNAGQGVFILSSFVLNGRVFEMFRNRFSGSSQRSSLNYSSDQQDKPSFSSSTMM